MQIVWVCFIREVEESMLPPDHLTQVTLVVGVGTDMNLPTIGPESHTSSLKMLIIVCL